MDKKTQNRLQRILEYAYNEVPYFNNIINEHINSVEEITPKLIRRLPIFDKQTIKDLGWINFVSNRYLDNEFKPILKNGARLERTSGTSGNPMHILWNQNDYFSSTLNHWKYRSHRFGITPASRLCMTSKTIPGGGLYYIQGNILFISIKKININTVPKIIKAINEFETEWLYIQNSILYILVYASEKLGLTFSNSIKYIEYIGEPICKYYRKKIEETINVPTANMYGCVETNGISYECICGQNHIMTENVLVDIVNQDGSKVKNGDIGYVCVTGLHNTAMPILKYRLNDLAILKTNTKCSCGNTDPIIHIKAARLPEYLFLNNYNIFKKAELFCPINSGINLFDEQPNDIFFNLKMNTLDCYEIAVYRSQEYTVNLEQMLREMFEAYGLPNINFTVCNTSNFDPAKPAGIIRLR